MKRPITFMFGFTLIELLVVIAIIGILATIAVPAYNTYTAKSHFTEVINATSPYKIAVEQCYQAAGAPATVSGCGAGSGGVPAAITAGATGSALTSVAVSTAGVITATASTNFGLASQTYILTPTVSSQTGGSNILIWAASGTCTAAGYC